MNPATLALIWALAQAAPAAKPAPAPSPSPTPSPTQAAPYVGGLLRLSEVMGALSFLRDLCGDRDGAAFREREQRLIEAEPRPQEEKDQLAGAFNRGYDAYRLSYRLCTSNARAAIAAYLAEAERLARDVATKYGGG